MKFFILKRKPTQLPCASFLLTNKPERGDPPECPECGTSLSPRIRLPPYRYRIDGPNVGDMLTDGMVVAVSEKFKQCFEASNLTGVSFSEDKVEFENAKLDFYMANFACTLTRLDEKQSGIVIDEVRGCDDCRVLAVKKLEQAVIDEATWSGEDAFKMGNLFGLVLVTEKFVRFVEDNELQNFRFVDAMEYREDWT